MPSRRAAAALTAVTLIVAIVAALFLPFSAQAAWPDGPVRLARQAAGGAPAIEAADLKP